ncbi:hypothetical protein EXU85_19625 [Spirosoma sp. KCTC 42546]|uniref:hypothetical protein n=1 Tax=Spirosoma sp. KCTC 42546 TaxID=2520506 RepID=UPI00115A3F54|nr:hypothetical protein [Spirosoma sp. KCTC 42546]QDK80697.1 hypothetical protein EXU85_19625 [Spirosoma sp. KCTC 42546]
MTTHRYLTLFFLLAASITTAQAQPAIALNTITTSTEPGATKKAPLRTKAAVESPFYIKIYGFYGLLTPGSQVNSSTSSSSTGAVTSFKTSAKGLGAGPRAGIGIGTIVSDFINIGIDADMLFGPTLTTDNIYQGSNYLYTSTTTTTFRVLSITPNITFKALSRPSYYIYNRLGIVGGIVLDYKTVQTSLNKPNVGVSTANVYTSDFTKNSLSIGYQAALGIQFRLSQSLRGFAEVVAYNQSFQPKEVTNTNVSTSSGKVTTTTTVTQYKSEGDYTNNSPYQSAIYNVAMNSVGVGVGLLFRF